MRECCSIVTSEEMKMVVVASVCDVLRQLMLNPDGMPGLCFEIAVAHACKAPGNAPLMLPDLGLAKPTLLTDHALLNCNVSDYRNQFGISPVRTEQLQPTNSQNSPQQPMSSTTDHHSP